MAPIGGLEVEGAEVQDDALRVGLAAAVPNDLRQIEQTDDAFPDLAGGHDPVPRLAGGQSVGASVAGHDESADEDDARGLTSHQDSSPYRSRNVSTAFRSRSKVTV